MHLQYLDYLGLVIAHGSFAAAARAGGVSQPAISHGMKQLQAQLDKPLFTSVGRRLMPTEFAVQAAALNQEFREGIAGLTAQRASRARPGTLRVGLTASAALVCGPVLHACWCADGTQRVLEMSSADEGRMLAALQRGALDLVIAPLPRAYPATGLAHRALYKIAPLAYAARRHPLAQVQSLQDLQGASWAIVGPSVSGPVDVLREAFAVRRLGAPRVGVSCPDYACMLRLMASRKLLGVLPHPALLASAAKDEIVPLRLRETLPLYDMHAFTAAPPRKRIAALLAEVAHRLAAGDV